jgi:DNA-binding SARP family transcriptional activator/predicted ATPase
MCYLAVTNKVQTRGALAGLLWSDYPEHRARSNLRDTLALLRRTPLAPHLEIGRRAVSFNRESPYWLDTAEFQQGMDQGIRRLPEDPSSLEAAVELYRGKFLAGFQVPKAALFEEWVTVQRQQLYLLAVEALQQLVAHYLDAGKTEAGYGHACRLLVLDPWREESHRNLMLLQLLKGEHSAALKQYEQCRQILADELGVDPSPETQALFQNIRKQNSSQIALDKVQLPPDGSSPTGLVSHNIPGQVTPFIGREKEQRAIDNVLGDRTGRLITIYGVGGSGKTRLALAIGEKQLKAIERDGGFRFKDGVFFVPLEAVESLTEIVPAICQAITFQPADESQVGRSIERQLLGYLRRKRLLLIIDNFEQLLDGVGLLAKIHRSAADVHMLVTSRQKLALQGERLYALEGMSYPKAGDQVTNSEELLSDYPAAGLFAASARRVKPDFRLYEEEVPALTDLCQLVDGLPLAIELAAGWANVLSLDDIVLEIRRGLSFLESDLSDLPDRHRNLEAVFDVSWRRLTRAEQMVFGQLCVFRGGFTRHVAAQVIGASLRQLATLVNKALIQYDKKRDRYQVHRLLRQFGSDKLAQDPEVEKSVRGRHSSFYAAALQQWDRQLKGAGQLEALAEFEKESANVRSAWHFAAEIGQFANIDRAADGLGRLYLWRRRFHEGETAFRLAAEKALNDLSAEAAKKHAAETTRIVSKIQLWESVFSDREKANELVGQALKDLESPVLAAVDTRLERAFGLQRAGDLAFDDDVDEARRLYRQSLALFRELRDDWGTAKVLTDLGWEAAHHGEMEAAWRLGEEAMTLVQAMGDSKRMADVLWLLGTLAIQEGDDEKASRLLGESLDIREKLGDRITDIESVSIDLGMTLTWIGRMNEANEVREETLALYESQGQPEQIALAHIRLSTSKMHIGQLEAAERHAHTGLEMCRKLGNQRGVGIALWLLGAYAQFAGEVGKAESLLQESLATLRQVGAAAEVSWVYGVLAIVAHKQARPVVAKRYLIDTLHTAVGVFSLIAIQFGLCAHFQLLADEGQLERAVEIGALLERHPISSSVGFQSTYAERLAELRTLLPPEVLAKSEARGRARDFHETAAEILAELESLTLPERE